MYIASWLQEIGHSFYICMAKCSPWLEALEKAKGNNTAHIDLCGLCTYGQIYASLVAYFKGIGKLTTLGPRRRKCRV